MTIGTKNVVSFWQTSNSTDCNSTVCKYCILWLSYKCKYFVMYFCIKSRIVNI